MHTLYNTSVIPKLKFRILANLLPRQEYAAYTHTLISQGYSPSRALILP